VFFHAGNNIGGKLECAIVQVSNGNLGYEPYDTSLNINGGVHVLIVFSDPIRA